MSLEQLGFFPLHSMCPGGLVCAQLLGAVSTGILRCVPTKKKPVLRALL